MLRLRRLAVLIGAEESHVEVVTRIGEVVVVASEERDLLFDRKDQSKVGVLLESIQPVFAAAVQRDDLALHAGLPDRLFFYGGGDGLALVARFFVRSARLDRRLHASGHVFI